MLLYPIVYTLLVLPLSIARWMAFVDDGFSDLQTARGLSMATATLIFHATFRLSGAVNVGLVLTTRPNVLLFGESNREDDEDDEAGEAVNPGRPGQNNGRYPLRQRGAGQGTNSEMEDNTTGFGGPAVRLDRDEDDMR